MSELKPKHYIALLVTLFALAWWFRYDTHCAGGGNAASCVSYDRFTGNFVSPYIEIREARRKASQD